MKHSSRFPHLMNAAILRDFSDTTKMAFLDSCGLREFDKSNVILRQGDYTDGLFIVAKGHVEVSFLSEWGHHSIIYHAVPGQILGATEAISERPCAGTCTALSHSALLYCPKKVLFEHLLSPTFIRNFAADIHDVLCHDNEFKSVDQFYTVEQKICIYLNKLSAPDSVFKETQGYLADVVGCSRQTVNKELGRLRDLNLIETTKNGIAILNAKALTKRVSELDVRRTY